MLFGNSPIQMFKIIKKDKHTKARLGVLETPHGVIKTPTYVMVGTYGKFLHLKPHDLKKTNTQLIIANTFHLWKRALRAQNLKLKDKNRFNTFLTQSLGLNIPTMTD